MIVKIRIPEAAYKPLKEGVYNVRVGYPQGLTYLAEVLDITLELTEKEKLLAKIFGFPVSQEIKEVLAQIVNKVYEK